jgi:hypothetical protein
VQGDGYDEGSSGVVAEVERASIPNFRKRPRLSWVAWMTLPDRNHHCSG